MFSAQGHFGTPLSFDAGFRPALAAAAAMSFAGAGVALLVAPPPACAHQRSWSDAV